MGRASSAVLWTQISRFVVDSSRSRKLCVVCFLVFFYLTVSIQPLTAKGCKRKFTQHLTPSVRACVSHLILLNQARLSDMPQNGEISLLLVSVDEFQICECFGK
jgi:hypothetical protein